MIFDLWFKFKQFIRQSFCHHEYVDEGIPIIKSIWVCRKCGREAKKVPPKELRASTESNKS